MFKIIKISESQLLSANTKVETKPAEKAEAKPAEKAEAKSAEKADPKIKLKKFTPKSYDYKEDEVFMDLEILAESYAKESKDPVGQKITDIAKTDPQKAYEIALNSYVNMDHKFGIGMGMLDPDQKLKAKKYLGYKLKGSRSTFEECLEAIKGESYGDTMTGWTDYQQAPNKAYAELITGLKKWDKKLKKMMTPEQPVKKAPAKKSDEAPKTEKKEAPKPKGESSLLSEANMIDGLVKLSNHLDSIDVLEEADFADKIINKIARNTLVFDLDSGEVFDKGIKDWRNPTDGELANAFFGDPEPLGDVGDLNPDSISYKKDEDGDDGVLELRDTEGDEIAEIIVDEPPENEISWHNLSREHVDSRPKNMTLPDGSSVTIEEIKLESNEMIKELVRLANHLDNKGFAKEADYLDRIIKQSSTSSHDSSTIQRSEGDLESLTQRINVSGSGKNISSGAQERTFKVGEKEYSYSYDRDTVEGVNTMELRVSSSDNQTEFTATKNFGSTNVKYETRGTEESPDEDGFISFIKSLLEKISDQGVKTSLKTLSSMFVSTANSSKLSA